MKNFISEERKPQRPSNPPSRQTPPPREFPKPTGPYPGKEERSLPRVTPPKR